MECILQQELQQIGFTNRISNNTGVTICLIELKRYLGDTVDQISINLFFIVIIIENGLRITESLRMHLFTRYLEKSLRLRVLNGKDEIRYPT